MDAKTVYHIVHLGVAGVIFFFLGYLIKYRHAYYLIAGYDKQRDGEPKEIANMVGTLCFIVGAFILFAAVYTYFRP